MAERGTLEPTPAQRDRARRAGFVATSPAWVGAAAWVGGAAAIAIGGGALTGALVAEAHGAWATAAGPGATARARDLAITDPLLAIAALAAPILLAAAGAALLAHVVLAGGVWQPRRSIRGAPVAARDLGRRTRDAGLAAVRGAIVLAVAARFAAVHLGDAYHLAAGATAIGLGGAAPAGARSLLAAAGAHVAIAALLIAALDALVRWRSHRADLRQTPRARADDDRAARGDPRWRAARRRAARPGAPLDDLALVVIGDAGAAAIAWHPRRHPRATIVAHGRGPAARALIAQARRRQVDALHAPALAAALAAHPLGPVPAARAAEVAALLARAAPR